MVMRHAEHSNLTMTAHQPRASTRRSLDAVQRTLVDWIQQRPAYAAAEIIALERPAGAGLSNETYLFDCRSARGVESLVMQVGPAGEGLFRDYDLVGMARIQQQLGAISSVPVPTVRWVEADPAWLAAPFYVMNRVPGRVPGDNPTYHQAGWFSALPVPERAAAWHSGITALARLHRLEPAAGFSFLQDAPWGMGLYADPVAVRLRQWRDFMRWGARSPLLPLAQALNALENSRPAARKPRIAWGDAKLSNCVIEQGQVTALLDWELCGLSDPDEDLAFWLLLDWAHWRIPGVARLAALPTANDTLEHYAHAGGQPSADVLWWFKFGLVRLAIIFNRFIERRVEMGRLPPEVDAVAANPVCSLLPEVLAMKELP